MEFFNLQGVKRPSGYSHAVLARGRTLCLSGVIGWDKNQQFQSDDLLTQVQQALQTIAELLAQAKAKPEHVIRMTWYLLDKREYLAASREIGQVYRAIFGSHYPAMSAVVVAGLIEDRARVEIEVTAIVPDE